MEHRILEKVLNCHDKCIVGVTLVAVILVNEDADSGTLVDGVVVENVDTADALAVVVNHQTQLVVREQVVVIHQELLDLEQ